jgi:rare lipoprotein A
MKVGNHLMPVLLLLLTCPLVGCAHATTPAQGGIASYYADAYHGRTTASGETFDMYELTAAHRTLPFGTRVRVTNLDNGRSVTVRINDRGPFIDGRVIDLSLAAAQRLDMVEAGIVPVKLEVVDAPTELAGVGSE